MRKSLVAILATTLVLGMTPAQGQAAAGVKLWRENGGWLYVTKATIPGSETWDDEPCGYDTCTRVKGVYTILDDQDQVVRVLTQILDSPKENGNWFGEVGFRFLFRAEERSYGRYSATVTATWEERSTEGSTVGWYDVESYTSNTLVEKKVRVKKYRQEHVRVKGTDRYAARYCFRQRHGNCSFSKTGRKGELFIVGTYARAFVLYRIAMPRGKHFLSKHVAWSQDLEEECWRTTFKWTRTSKRRFKVLVRVNGYDGQAYCGIRYVQLRYRETYYVDRWIIIV